MSIAGAAAAAADWGSAPAPPAARRPRTVGFTGSDERSIVAWALAARLAGGAEIRRDPDGTMSMKVMHSKESIPAAVMVQEEALVARVRHSAAREEEWRKKEAEARQRVSTAPPKPSKNAKRHANERAKLKELKREHAQLLAEKEQQQQQQQGGEAMEVASEPQPQQQQQQNKPAAAAAAAAPDGAGTVAEVDGKLLEQVIAQLTQLAPLCSGFGAAETRDRHIYLTSGFVPMRLPVKVKANTKGASWTETEFGERLENALRGARAEQWQEPLMKFVKEELDAPWNSGSEASPFGAGAAQSPFGRA